MVLGIIFFDVLGNDKLEMKCTITEELENNKPAINKNYTEKDIFIFIDRVNLWVSDISYKKWQNQNKEIVGKIEKKWKCPRISKKGTYRRCQHVAPQQKRKQSCNKKMQPDERQKRCSHSAGNADGNRT